MSRLRMLEFDSPVGAWRLWLWQPAPDLAHAVASLWATDARTVPFRERILPRDTVELMVNFGGPQWMHRSGKAEVFRRAWVSGLHTGCIEIESPVAAQLVAASLRPAHAGTVLGAEGRELAGRVMDLDHVMGRAASHLADRLEECGSVPGRFQLFEEFLRARLRVGRPATPSVARAVARITASGGQARIADIGEELRCSTRHLQQRVLAEVGLTPKQFSRLLRFSRAVDGLRGGVVVDWARVAASCGYFDQSHFHRDFVHFAGVTPSVFLGSRDPSSQAILCD